MPKKLTALLRWKAMLILRARNRPALWSFEESVNGLAMYEKFGPIRLLYLRLVKFSAPAAVAPTQKPTYLVRHNID